MSRRSGPPLAIVFLVGILLAGAGGVHGEVFENKALRVSLEGGMAPHRLPRSHEAPVSVHLSADIDTSDGSRPPTLHQLVLDVNRHGKISDRGLPRCRLRELEQATSSEALDRCRRALVGDGRITAQIALPEQAPLPSDGRLLAFNGRIDGTRVILAHIYGPTPLPVTAVVTFTVARTFGRYGTALTAELPSIASDWGYVTRFEMSLGRRYRYRGRSRSYLSADCPAPQGFPGAVFSLARGSFAFQDGSSLSGGLVRSCAVKK